MAIIISNLAFSLCIGFSICAFLYFVYEMIKIFRSYNEPEYRVIINNATEIRSTEPIKIIIVATDTVTIEDKKDTEK